MTLRDLSVKIGFQIDHQKLSKLESQLEGIKHRLSFLAGVEAAKYLFELGERFADVGEQIHIAALAAGVGVEAFQKLAYAANQNGVSQEELSRSLGLLSKHLYDARMGSEEAQKAFRQAGFTSEQVRGFRNANHAILALSDRMKAEQDPIKRAALGRELLGRNSQRMALFLSQGAKALREEGEEAERFGLILSGPQVHALEELDHSLKKVFSLFKAFGALIAAQIAPSMKFLVDKFLELWAANRELISVNVENWLSKVAYGMGYVAGLITGLIQRMRQLAEAFHVENDILLFVGSLASLLGVVFALSKGWSAFLTIAAPTIALFSSIQAGVALLIEGVAYLTGSMGLLSAAALIAEAPIWAIVAAVGALIVAAHDLYAIFSGGKTWSGGLWEGAKNFFSGGPDSAASQFGQGAATGVSASKVPSYGGLFASQGEGSASSVTIPMTFNNVPNGTDPKDMGNYVKQAVKEHLDSNSRATQRALAPVIMR